MPKRSAEQLQAVVPAPKVGDGGLKSRSGRVVKPRVWDDGTLAAPLAGLSGDGGEPSPGGHSDRAAADDRSDPDYDAAAAAHSEDRGSGGAPASAAAAAAGQHHRRGAAAAAGSAAPTSYSEEEDEEVYSDDSPRISGEGSQGGGSMGRARSGSVGRDEHGKFTSGPRPRGSRGARGGRGEGGGGGIFKMAAVEVLRLEKRLMSTGEIARVALKRGLIKCTGKTPEATMASALYTDIKRKEGQSIFIRPHEGLFGLREWIEQGVAFQDEFAEEMAKRARAAFGAFVGMPGMPGMLPPMVDSEGVPISMQGTPYAPMMPFPGMPPMPGMGMPLPPGAMGLGGLPPAAAAAMAAAAAAAGGAEDGPDGLMELLSAAEELHKSASKDVEGADVKYAADGAAIPAAAAQEAAAAAAADGSTGAAAAMDVEQPHEAAAAAEKQPQQQSEGAAAEAQQEVAPAMAGSQGEPAAAAATAASPQQEGEDEAEDDDAAAMLAAVAEAAAEEPTSRHSSEGAEAAPLRQQQSFPGFAMPEAAAGGMQYAMQYPPYGYSPYGYYPHPHAHQYMYTQPPAAPGLPPLPRHQQVLQQQAEAELGAELGGSSVELVVRGSNRPFAALTAAAAAGRHAGASSAAAAMEVEGQEQVNILNLPLPEIEAQAGGGSAHGAAAAVADLEPAQLKEAEVQVMQLEKELGTSHPEVGKAYLSLSRLYLAGVEESSSKQLAVAALSRAAEIMSVCQLALKRQPSCTSSFTYLMDKIRSAEHRPAVAAAPAPARPLGAPVAHGEAAHVALPGSSTPPAATVAAH